MTLNPHLGEFSQLSLGEPPVWQTVVNGTDIETQTGDGTVAMRIAPDGTVTFPQGLDSDDVTGAIDADTLDGLDSTAFVQTTDAIDADTLDGLDSTGFYRTDEPITTTDPITVNGETVLTTATDLSATKIQTLASDPETPAAGDIWYNSTDDEAKVRLADSTVILGGTEVTDPGSGTVLADFEDGVWPGNWQAGTADYSIVTSPALTGTRSLRNTTNYSAVTNSAISTPRDGTYTCLVQATTGAAPGLLTNCQDTVTPFGSCYWAQIHETSNHLQLAVRNPNTTLETTNATINPNTPYRLKLILTANSVQARVETTSGAQVAQTSTYTRTDHSGGYIGIYPGGSGNSYYDDFQKE